MLYGNRILILEELKLFKLDDVSLDLKKFFIEKEHDGAKHIYFSPVGFTFWSHDADFPIECDDNMSQDWRDLVYYFLYGHWLFNYDCEEEYLGDELEKWWKAKKEKENG